MKAMRVMTVNVTCVDPDTPIAHCWKVMKRLHARHLPVVKSGTLLGVISDRDLLLRATRKLDGDWLLPELCASEVMSFHPVTARMGSTVSHLASLMIEHRIDCVPITDVENRLHGLVTSSDLIQLLVDKDEKLNVVPINFVVKHARELALA